MPSKRVAHSIRVIQVMAMGSVLIWSRGCLKRDIFRVSRPSGLVWGIANSRGHLLVFRNAQPPILGRRHLTIDAPGVRHYTTPPEPFDDRSWPTHADNSGFTFSGGDPA